MTTFAALWMLALVLYLAFWIVRAIDAFQQYEQRRAESVYRANCIVQDETRRHGRAVADAQAWAALHHSRFDAVRKNEAEQAVMRG